MSPRNPQDPQKGKPHEDVQAAADASAAKQESVREPAEQPDPQVREGGTPSGEGAAAEVTGVDKGAVDALAAVGDEEPQAAPGDDDPAAAGDDDPAAAGDGAPAGGDSAEAAATPDDVAGAEVPADAPTGGTRRRETRTVGEDAAEAAAALEEADEAGPGDERSEAAEPTDQQRADADADQAEETGSPRRSRIRRGRKPAEEPQPAPRRTPAPVGVTVRAQAKYVRTSARKARLVCDHIRGKDVNEARAILAFTPRGAAEAWSKLLESAVANAEHNHELVGEDLRILSVHADEGPTLKRFRPRAMGRATRIRKRTSHLSITLTPKES